MVVASCNAHFPEVEDEKVLLKMMTAMLIRMERTLRELPSVKLCQTLIKPSSPLSIKDTLGK
ncbi:unnamed protein product [Onchocerca flexuosa]|uniref:NR LBD domain-containing protein n=1 Tax=Onchocerca flexuosa TaxID=387005 RepID=A0A183H017_9BILA|nr:unnamed protein product [Onchocerca flexuosa]